MHRAKHIAFALSLASGIQSASSFALLGPFAPWMVPPLAYQVSGAIGGPMLIGQGYRWNVPVVTYGYDQSFLDYFGTNGVAAVESAIQILNDLPPASQTILSNYPSVSYRINYTAQSQSLLDLKSVALSMLLEQMGLAQPSSSVYCLRNFSYDPVSFLASYSVETRNFDPVSFAPSQFVNTGAFLGPSVWLRYGSALVEYLYEGSSPYYPLGGVDWLPTGEATALGTLDFISSAIFPIAVADGQPGSQTFYDTTPEGRYFRGLTMDDVGGLAYQLNTNNVAFENLLPDVHGSGTNTDNFVGAALRPGVDKITFQRTDALPGDPRVFPVITNEFVDTYITNGSPRQQILERVITGPDILFTAKYIGLDNVSRTGTTNWVNNGGPGNDGPGVIQPPIVINFNRLGPSLSFDDVTYTPLSAGYPVFPFWGSFDGTTNPPIMFPVNPNTTNSTEFHFYLRTQSTFFSPTNYTWNLIGPPNSLFVLQTSTNLTDWLTLATITNLGGTFTYEDYAYPTTPQRFFRAQPQ